MNRKDMQKVDFLLNTGKDFHNELHASGDKDIKSGWFHEWSQCGNQEEGMEKYALVEDENGLVHEVASHRIRFDPAYLSVPKERLNNMTLGEVAGICFKNWILGGCDRACPFYLGDKDACPVNDIQDMLVQLNSGADLTKE